MEWLALLDPGLLISGIALIGVLFSAPFFIASMRRLRQLKLVRGTLFSFSGEYSSSSAWPGASSRQTWPLTPG